MTVDSLKLLKFSLNTHCMKQIRNWIWGQSLLHWYRFFCKKYDELKSAGCSLMLSGPPGFVQGNKYHHLQQEQTLVQPGGLQDRLPQPQMLSHTLCHSHAFLSANFSKKTPKPKKNNNNKPNCSKKTESTPFIRATPQVCITYRSCDLGEGKRGVIENGIKKERSIMLFYI